MSQNFRISVDDSLARAKMTKLRSRFTPSGVDSTIRRVAWITHRRLVQRTPKKWTGQTRRSWRVFRRGVAEYSVTNKGQPGKPNVMVFLEKGTKGHGPRRAKRLFIPLTRKTALAGARKVMESMKSGSAREGGKTPYKIGKDFVLARRVRGIKAMKIVASQRPLARVTLFAAMKLHIRKILAEP